MLAEAQEMPETRASQVPVIVRHLEDGDAVVRAAAARALAGLGDPAAAPALAQALLDEDPDVRADAMAALAVCATVAEREAILQSLRGDPVPEVKVAAVQALGRLGGADAVGLLMTLASDRAADEIVWDDTDSVWDDWLDVQAAAISALGALKVTEAIPVLLAARQDEFGQDLNTPVFSALAAMGKDGIAVLLTSLKDPSDRVRRRAASALQRADPDLIESVAVQLCEDPAAELRQMGLRALPSEHALTKTLMLFDTEASVRCTAVAHHAPQRVDLLTSVLDDADASVVSIALRMMLDGRLPGTIPDLAENLPNWAQDRSAELAEPALRFLARLAPKMAAPILRAIALDDTKELTLRTSSISMMPEAGACDRETLAPLPELLANQARQIRLVSLAALAQLCDHNDAVIRGTALELLATVIAGEFPLPGVAEETSPQETDTAASDLATPKMDTPAAEAIRIAPDGSIVAHDEGDSTENVIHASFPKSTLSAIQEPQARGTSSTAKTEHRRRVAITGPTNFAEDVRIAALNVLCTIRSEVIDAVILNALESGSDDVRIAALRAVGRRPRPLGPTSSALVLEALGDSTPEVRLAAVEALSADPTVIDALSELATDTDPCIRAHAIALLSSSRPEIGMAALNDKSSVVRQSAALALINEDVYNHGEVVRILLRAGHSETVKMLARKTPDLAQHVTNLIAKPTVGRTSLISALEVLADRLPISIDLSPGS